MINVIVMTHGEFARGLINSVQMILGEQENLTPLVFSPQMSLDSLVDKLECKIQEFDNDNPTVLFVDLLGGSPSNAVAMLLGRGVALSAVCGVNLPMLLEFLINRNTSRCDTLIKQAEETGKDGIVNIVERFNEEKV